MNSGRCVDTEESFCCKIHNIPKGLCDLLPSHFLTFNYLCDTAFYNYALYVTILFTCDLILRNEGVHVHIFMKPMVNKMTEV